MLKKTIFCLMLASISVSSMLAKDALVRLASPKIDYSDMTSIKRGAKHFKQSCLACHSLKYAKYNLTLAEAGITVESMPTWPEDSWGGHPPPDLSLETLITSPDWIYTYLITYYHDPNQPTGFNNLAYPGTSMPNPFTSMQGKQTLVNNQTLEELVNKNDRTYWYRVINLDKQGSMSPGEFEEYVADIVNFLHHIADPSHQEREQIRGWLMLYLLCSIGVTAMIYRYYKQSENS